MIDELRVENVALIREATLNFSSGLTTLTGETGAGKTALLSALKLLIGERADASAVREGAQNLLVEGRVYLGQDDLDGHVVRRRVDASGRGRVEVDSHMASVGELAQSVGATVELCGQHEHQRLMQTQTHAAMLDAWAGARVQDALSSYQEAYEKASVAKAELERLQELSRAGSERLDQAEFELRRIDEVAPKEGELEELEEALPRAEHAEALLLASEHAREALAGDGGVADSLGEAMSALTEASRFDESLSRFADTLNSSLIDIEDVASELRDYRDSVEIDPADLERMQTRMAALQGLMRSFGPSMADVFERRAKAAEIVEAAGDSGELLRSAKKALESAEAELGGAAEALDSERKAAAPKFSAEVAAQMERLEMGSASVEFSFERLGREHWTENGPSKIELMYRPGAELSARPLRRIASGGEISRVMLAIKVVMGEADGIDTLVFDEVDAGVGGAVARSLAAVLKDLARTHQVIVVTHLAQVAVMADKHYVVTKSDGAVPETHLTEVAEEARVAEIARMLAGDTTDISLQHAEALLAEARA